MLWEQYIFCRNDTVYGLWDNLLTGRQVKLLYITGQGFDIRARIVLERFLGLLRTSTRRTIEAELLVVIPEKYNLSDDLEQLTAENKSEFQRLFGEFGAVKEARLEAPPDDEESTASQGLRLGVKSVLEHIKDHTDVILDTSTLPRIAYLAIMTAILKRLVPDVGATNALYANGVNFQVLVAEDAVLDSRIQSEDPSDNLVYIPGFSAILHAESVREWPLVWLPILGENRVGQFSKVVQLAEIGPSAEVMPILPHPSTDPRRADNLLIEYRQQLFDSSLTTTGNLLFAHESHPFEAYRQLLGAMERYKKSLQVLGGCRILMTPLCSKMMAVAAGLACFEMRRDDFNDNYGVGIAYANPKRYTVPTTDLLNTVPNLSALLLTGMAYERPED